MFLAAARADVNEKRVKQLKRVLDTDKSGEVDCEEFVGFCEAPDAKGAVQDVLNELAEKKAKRKKKKQTPE